MKDKDSEQQYPSRQPRRSTGNGNGQQNIPLDEQEIIIRPRKSQQPSSTPPSSSAASTPSRRPLPSQPPQSVQQVDDEEEDERIEPMLPANGLLYALIAGVVGGVLASLLNVAITFLNAGTFAEAAQNVNKIGAGTAYAIVGLACLNLFISIVTAVVTGYIIGKIAVQRRLGFYAGALVGIIVYLGSFLVRYIPNYPGNVSASNGTAGGAATALLISFIFLCVWGGVGGLLGLFGARTATKRHPYYYVKYVEDEEEIDEE